MNPEFTNNPLFSSWPFWVLALTPLATIADIEKASREITAQLNFGVEKAKHYATPLGPLIRDEYIIREAKSKLIDPNSRLLAEYWYVEPARVNTRGEGADATSIEQWYNELGVQMWAQ